MAAADATRVSAGNCPQKNTKNRREAVKYLLSRIDRARYQRREGSVIVFDLEALRREMEEDTDQWQQKDSAVRCCSCGAACTPRSKRGGNRKVWNGLSLDSCSPRPRLLTVVDWLASAHSRTTYHRFTQQTPTVTQRPGRWTQQSATSSHSTGDAQITSRQKILLHVLGTRARTIRTPHWICCSFPGCPVSRSPVTFLLYNLIQPIYCSGPRPRAHWYMQ